MKRKNKDKVWESIADFLLDKKITVQLLNYRSDCIYQKEYENYEDKVITFSLSEEESSQIPPGSYTLRIEINSLPEVNSNLVKNLFTLNNKVIVK